MSFKNIKSDLRAIYGTRISGRVLVKAACNPSFVAVMCVRVAASKRKPIHVLGRIACIGLFGIDVGYGAEIGPGLYLPHPISIVIGQAATIGKNVTLYHGVTIGSLRKEYPRLGNGVVIYPNTIIIGSVSVTDNKKIAPGSVLRP